jgi:hypothetical protein
MVLKAPKQIPSWRVGIDMEGVTAPLISTANMFKEFEDILVESSPEQLESLYPESLYPKKTTTDLMKPKTDQIALPECVKYTCKQWNISDSCIELCHRNVNFPPFKLQNPKKIIIEQKNVKYFIPNVLMVDNEIRSIPEDQKEDLKAIHTNLALEETKALNKPYLKFCKGYYRETRNNKTPFCLEVYDIFDNKKMIPNHTKKHFGSIKKCRTPREASFIVENNAIILSSQKEGPKYFPRIEDQIDLMYQYKISKRENPLKMTFNHYKRNILLPILKHQFYEIPDFMKADTSKIPALPRIKNLKVERIQVARIKAHTKLIKKPPVIKKAPIKIHPEGPHLCKIALPSQSSSNILDRIRVPIIRIVQSIIKLQRLWRLAFLKRNKIKKLAATIIIQRMLRCCKFRTLYIDVRGIFF